MKPIAPARSFPYTHHFPKPHKVKKIRQGLSVVGRDILVSGKMQEVIHEASIKGLRAALDSLLDLTESADFVATFALGGIVPLHYITRKLEKRHVILPNKFHLFAGLNWRTRKYNVKARFLNWLNGLPDRSHVLIFDTGAVGNAAGTIAKAVIDFYRDGGPQPNLVITVVVIAEESPMKDRPPRKIKSAKTGKSLDISTGFLRVPSNDFEDANFLQGYDSLRIEGKINAQKTVGAFLVEFEDGNRSGLASGDLAGGFLKLLLEDGILSTDFMKRMNPFVNT